MLNSVLFHVVVVVELMFFFNGGVVVLKSVSFHHTVVELNRVLFCVEVVNCIMSRGTSVVLNCVEFSGSMVV